MCHAEKMELCCSKRQIKLPGIQWTQQPRYLSFPIPIFSPDDTARKGDWVLCLPCLPILSVLHLPHLALRLPRASRVVRGSRQAAGRVWVCELHPRTDGTTPSRLPSSSQAGRARFGGIMPAGSSPRTWTLPMQSLQNRHTRSSWPEYFRYIHAHGYQLGLYPRLSLQRLPQLGPCPLTSPGWTVRRCGDKEESQLR